MSTYEKNKKDYFLYKGRKTREIAFPLGGIGTGCISLSGSGRLVDWEIHNRPDKGSLNGYSHFAVKAESNGKLIDARALLGDYPAPYTGSTTKSMGHGVSRTAMANIPHFENITFDGQFPFAAINYKDDHFPGLVKMTAFNPFIPLNDKDSSIPGAFFEIEIYNTSGSELSYTVCLSVSNLLSKDRLYNCLMQHDKITGIQMKSGKYKENAPEYGDLSISTDYHDVSYQQYWYRGNWFDSITTFWKDFKNPGKLKNRVYDISMDSAEHGGKGDTCSIAAHMRVEAGMKKKVRFLITWNFPNCYKYWITEECSCEGGCGGQETKVWKNHYASVFNDSISSAVYGMQNWDRLYSSTYLFENALFSSSMPNTVIDAISSNLSTLKSPTVLRLEDGSFYAWEGCSSDTGCCEGSCTHVWNYAYALSFLFPKLERSMRSLDYKYNQREDGSMCFRLQLPPGEGRGNFRACADGQFGGVIKAYRDWKISGDTEWLKSIWEEIKKSIDFAWSDSNEDKWDADMDGVLEGRQHHTLDMELFGPNSWLNGFYLAALKAGAEMAGFLGESETASEYMKLFEAGKSWTDKNLFNGEYYYQLIDLKDKSIIEHFGDGGSILDISTEKAYWNEEINEIKYQVGEGCGIDQVIAQWHANIIGLGEVFDPKQTQKALQSIYKYNFKNSFRNFFNPCRTYALNDEAGVVICEWPEDKCKPAVPAPYSEECWTGCEYQVAAHMIQEGLVSEGIDIIDAVRNRYDGEKRNPWNEFECGSHYARGMSSYSLLNAFSGFEFDMVKGMIGFNPVRYNESESSRYFWSLDPAWGVFRADRQKIEIKVLGGCLRLNFIHLPFIKEHEIRWIEIEGIRKKFENEKGYIAFKYGTSIEENKSLKVIFK